MLTLAPLTWLRQQLGHWTASAGSREPQTNRAGAVSEGQVQGDCYTDGKPGLEGAASTVTHLVPESLVLILQRRLTLNSIFYRNTEQEESTV